MQPLHYPQYDSLQPIHRAHILGLLFAVLSQKSETEEGNGPRSVLKNSTMMLNYLFQIGSKYQVLDNAKK